MNCCIENQLEPNDCFAFAPRDIGIQTVSGISRLFASSKDDLRKKRKFHLLVLWSPIRVSHGLDTFPRQMNPLATEKTYPTHGKVLLRWTICRRQTKLHVSRTINTVIFHASVRYD